MPAVIEGTGSPEGAVRAIVGKLYLQNDGENGKTLWQKRGDGKGATGWSLMQGALGVFNIKDFGAVGDGAVDDTSSIQAALNAAGAWETTIGKGGIVVCPPGQYVISEALRPPNGIIVSGAGRSTALYFTKVRAYCFDVGSDPNKLNYGNQITSLSIVLRRKDNFGIRLRGTADAVVRDVYIEGDTNDGYDGRTNIGVEIDGWNQSAFFNLIENVHCNHCHVGFKVHRTGTSYATCQTFVNCCAFGDKVYGDKTGYGFWFKDVISGSIGNGDGSTIVGGNLEEYSEGIRIDGGPIYGFGVRIEGCTAGVHFTNRSANNRIDCCRLPNYGAIVDDGIPGSRNACFRHDDAGWQGYCRYSATGAFDYENVHEFLTAYNSPVHSIHNKFGEGFSSDVRRQAVDATAAASFAHESFDSRGVTVAKLLGNGNWLNTNNSYGAISDRKLKRDVESAGSQLEDVKRLAAVMSKFRFKTDPQGPKQLGWVAQDVQAISPGLVYSTPDRDAADTRTGEDTLAIHYSVANLKAFKALGEVIEIVENLQIEVRSLRAALGDRSSESWADRGLA